jgi:hypothetical protein
MRLEDYQPSNPILCQLMRELMLLVMGFRCQLADKPSNKEDFNLDYLILVEEKLR